MSGYTKLFSSILDSTVWQEPDSTVRVWIAMLAMADAGGIVESSMPGLASRARVPLDACIKAIDTFLAPDPWSRTKDHDGRRIVAVDGGWALLNHAKYRAARAEDDRREYQRKLMAERRRLEREAKLAKTLAPVSTELAMLAAVSRSEPPLAQASASADSASKDQEKSSLRSDSSTAAPVDPPADGSSGGKQSANGPKLAAITDIVIAEYNAHLSKKAGGLLRTATKAGIDQHRKHVARCLKIASRVCEDLYQDPKIRPEFFAGYFRRCKEDKFLSGEQGGGKDHPNWMPDLEYLTRPETILRVYETHAPGANA